MDDTDPHAPDPRASDHGEHQEEPEARFELRVWGDLAAACDRLARAGRATGTSETDDCYLVGPRREVNAKVRDDRLEVKRLVGVDGSLQRWRPTWSVAVPATGSEVGRLRAAIGLDTDRRRASGGRDRHDAAAIAATVARAPDGRAIRVRKVRRHFDALGVMAEISEVGIVDHPPVCCLTIEDTDPDRLRAAADALGIAGLPNRPVHDVARSVLERQAHPGDG